MNKRIFAGLTLLIALLPSVAWAFIEWESSGADKSLQFLGILFGDVGTILIPVDGASSIMGALFNIFNVVLLSMGSIVLTYVIWMSAIETAHEGQALGKKWSMAWVPLRAVLGVGLLLPTSSGYSFSQIIMMWIIMHGVHAANGIWGIVLENFELGAVYATDTEGDTEISGASTAAQGMFESLICMEMVRQNYTEATSGLGGDIELYEHRQAMVLGVPDNEHHAEVCGGLKPSRAPSDYDEDVWRAQQLAAASNVTGVLSPYASEAVDGGNVSGSDVIMTARRTISAIISSTPKGDGDPVSLDTFKENAKQDGWLYVGSYYHKFSSWMEEFSPSNLAAPSVIKPDYSELPFTEAQVKARFTAYLEESDLLSVDERPPTELDLSRTEGMSGELAQFWDDAGLTDFFMGIATDFIDHLYNNDDDPIIGMQKLGTDLMITVEATFFVIVIAAFALLLIVGSSALFLPIVWMLSAVFSILMPLLTIFITTLWGAGVMLGIYVPLIPFLVFTFTAFTWFIYAVEAMVAAPVAALGMTNPSAENFGNIQPVMLLTLNLFLRPSLMVIGFIAAERILKVIVYMINFGYAATLEASLTGIGLFGAVVLVVLYCGIAVIAVKECFSLIHILPDKVIRWIGGQIEKGGNVDENVGQAKSYLDKGADAGASVMKGVVAAATAQQGGAPDDKSSDDKKEEEEGGDGEGEGEEGGEAGGEAGEGSEASVSMGESSGGAVEAGAGAAEGAGAAAEGTEVTSEAISVASCVV